MFALLIALYAAASAAVVWAACTVFSACVRRLEGVVAPFFGSVDILFVLLTGFLTGDIGDRNRQASRAVQANCVTCSR